MLRLTCRLAVLAVTLAAAPLQEAQAQAGRLQGAWLEEGTSCDSVFVATPGRVVFKRPASAFAPAFIVSGRRLTTPLATCGLVGVSSIGARQLFRLSCTSSIATDAARAILGPAEDGGLYRYHSLEGGIATKYRLCDREVRKLP